MEMSGVDSFGITDTAYIPPARRLSIRKTVNVCFLRKKLQKFVMIIW
jgi:hypothetical protein